MAPLVGEERIIEVSNDIPTEFTTNRYHPILDGKYLGMAWVNGNVNYSPIDMDLFTLTLYSSVYAMEFYHTVWKRLIPKGYEWIDVIHWLYNEDRLYTVSFRFKHHWYSLRGATYRIVVPDITYGWNNRGEIMEGIKSGKYRETQHQYSSDGLGAPATEHDLQMIKNWLVYGTTKGHH